MDRFTELLRRLLVPFLGLLAAAVLTYSWQQSASPGPGALAAAARAQSRSDGRNPALRVVAEGRVVAYPGAEVTVSTDFAGIIESVGVNEKDVVRRGDAIATIRADDTRAALAEAEGRVREIEADVRLQQSELGRQERLLPSGTATRQQYDRTLRELEVAQARRVTAEAEVERLRAVLAKARITSPISGVVVTRHAHPGEAASLGTPIVRIADLSRLRIEAEVDEYDAGRVRLGSAVTVHAEGYDGFWRGVVEEIPDYVTGRRVRPQDPARPTDVRVLPVKVALVEPTPLKLGQRVELSFTGMAPTARSGVRGRAGGSVRCAADSAA
jgi:HlyD family secretion protein